VKSTFNPNATSRIEERIVDLCQQGLLSLGKEGELANVAFDALLSKLIN